MNKIDYFKLQAKNLHKDYKAGTPTKRFPIDYRRVLNDLYEQETDVNNFTLMKAQHIIALMIGFDKWADLLKTSEEELEKRGLWFEKTIKEAFPQNDFVEEISKVLRPQDEIWMSEIFYAGGTAVKDISANDLVEDIQQKGKKAYFVEHREDFLEAVKPHFGTSSVVLLMGARDPSLETFTKDFFEKM